MLATYPVHSLLAGHALAIGAASYDGQVDDGIDGDRDAVSDVDVLAQCMGEALDELVEASSTARTRAPRGRLSTRGER
jgi:diacylglycerol O-acyltransferase